MSGSRCRTLYDIRKFGKGFARIESKKKIKKNAEIAILGI